MRAGLLWAAVAISLAAPARAAFTPSPTDVLASQAGRFVLRELGVPSRLLAVEAADSRVSVLAERVARELGASEDPAIRALLGDGRAIRPGSEIEDLLRAAVVRPILESGEWGAFLGRDAGGSTLATSREAFLAQETAAGEAVEAGLWPAVNEGRHDLPILARRPDTHGGYIYSLHHSRTMRFESGTTHLVYRSHPEAIENLGFRVYTDAEGRMIEEFPGPTAFSRRLEILRRLAPNLVADTRIRITNFPGGIPPRQYLGIVEGGEIPMAREATWFRHDILVHGFSFAVLIPRDVWAAYRAELGTAVRFADAAAASGDAELMRAGRALLEDRARVTDQVTANLDTGLFGFGTRDRARHLADSWDRLVLGPERLRSLISSLTAGRVLPTELKAVLDDGLAYTVPGAAYRESLAVRLLEFLRIPRRP